MATIYQRVTLVPPANVGPPGPLPADLVGLADESLADLPAAVGEAACEQLGYLNTGFLPVVVPDPPVSIQVANAALRIALHRLALLDDFNMGVAALGDTEATIIWEHGNYIWLSFTWVHLAADQVGISEPTLEAAFLDARDILT